MKSTNDAAVATVIGTVSVTATHLELVNQSTGATSGSAIAGATSDLQLRATDSNRNIDKDYAGVHAVAFYGLSAAGGYTPKVESTNFGTELGIYFPVSPGGVSTANAVTLTPYKMETANIYGSETGMSYFTYNVNVLAAAASSIALTSGNNQVSVINKAITPFVVTTQDLYTNAAAGTDVTFSIASYPTGGGGCSLGTTTTTTNSSGAASTILTLGAAAGTYQVQATNAALSGSPITFTATASAPTALEKVSGDSQTKYVGQAADAFVVRLVNESGTGISNETINFAITSYPSGATGQSLSAASAVTNAQGQASTILTLGNKTGSYVVRASYQILGGTLLTADFTVTAQPAVPYKAVLTGPTSVNAGAASGAFTVSIKDQNDNPSPLATGQSILFNLTTTPGATGTFYSDSACTAGNEITTVTVTEGTVDSRLLLQAHGGGLRRPGDGHDHQHHFERQLSHELGDLLGRAGLHAPLCRFGLRHLCLDGRRLARLDDHLLRRLQQPDGLYRHLRRHLLGRQRVSVAGGGRADVLQCQRHGRGCRRLDGPFLLQQRRDHDLQGLPGRHRPYQGDLGQCDDLG